MGADMSGYLVVGPRKITEKSIRKAASALLRKAKAEVKSSSWTCENCGAVMTMDTSVCKSCGYEHEDLSSIGYLLTAKAHVEQLIADWPPDYRDVTSRSSPFSKGQIIVFAGDMSWGDEPSGAGYQTLKRIMASGVSKELGIL